MMLASLYLAAALLALGIRAELRRRPRRLPNTWRPEGLARYRAALAADTESPRPVTAERLESPRVPPRVGQPTRRAVPPTGRGTFHREEARRGA